MKVVLDTNVLVSAALRDRDPEVVILWIVAQPDWQWMVSDEILREYKEVLGRAKFGFPEEVLHRWFALLETLTTLVQVDLPIEWLRDEKDAKFLACALSAEVDYFITGDHDFAELRELAGTVLISVSTFKQIVVDAP